MLSLVPSLAMQPWMSDLILLGLRLPGKRLRGHKTVFLGWGQEEKMEEQMCFEERKALYRIWEIIYR